MRLDFIPLDKLVPSKTNMRYAKKAPDVTDLLPTVRKRGVLQPVLVRPNCAPDGYEIVAGFRRYTAASIVADERRAAGDAVEPMPCAILDEDDDAAAVEASMIENMARHDADEVTQWESFTRLVKEGRDVDDIAATFGMPEVMVKRILALGNLLPRIRALYAKEQIDRATVRHLTLASKRQQQAWLALADDENAYCPTGHQLKAWLFGGQSIDAAHALFDVAASGLATVADLFGEDVYFADSDAFWAAQNAAIEGLRLAFIADGWSDAVVVPAGEHFSTWEYEKAGKRKGGRVYLDVRSSGEVVTHEGYVSRKEAARIARGGSEPVEKPKRPELTAALATYVDLHRHAAARAALTDHPSIALRLMAAHVLVGSSLWSVRQQSYFARDDATVESVENSIGETRFDERRLAVLAVLGMNPDRSIVTGGTGDDYVLVTLFHRLLDVPDACVMDVIAVAMGETLAAGGAAVEAVGRTVGLDMAQWWSADPALFALLRDKQVLTALVAEVAGETVAAANAKEKGTSLKRIVTDHLDGSGGRTKVEGWVPRWMTFPPAAYTPRGGVGPVAASAKAKAALASVQEPDASSDEEPDPAAPPQVAAASGAGKEGEDMPLAA